MKEGKVTPGEDVHHIKSPFINGEINYNLLLDDKNLMTLCKECHAKQHVYGNKPTPEQVLNALEELMKTIPD